MKCRRHYWISLLISFFLCCDGLFLLPLQSKTSVVLIFEDLDHVSTCDFKEPILSSIESRSMSTRQVELTQMDQRIVHAQTCINLLETHQVPRSTLALIPMDPFYTSEDQWNLTWINTQDIWDHTLGSNNVIVAVIDTGVNTQSPIVDFNVGTIILGASFLDGQIKEDTSLSEFSYDGGSHGTAVASLIASAMNDKGLVGIAPNVKIMPLKVIKDATTIDESVTANNSDIAAAIRWAVDHGADIINLSLGGPADPDTQSAVQYAAAQGVLMVAASGNNSNNALETYYDVAYPAAYPEVIAVGSVKMNHGVSDFSNIAGTGIDLSAYGEQILLPWVASGVYGYASGTSFSAPTVSGVLALILSLYPDLSRSEVTAILLSGVSDVKNEKSAAGWDSGTGYGVVNAYHWLPFAIDFVEYHDENKDFDTAAFLNEPVTESLRPILDVDYFSFTINESKDIVITAQTEDIQDLVLQLYDGSRNPMMKVDEAGSGGTEMISVHDLSPGTYYLSVNDFAGRAYASNYTLSLSSQLLGDLNASGNITTTDLVQLRQYLAGLITLNSSGQINADLNKDGHLSITDLVLLRRMLAGLE